MRILLLLLVIVVVTTANAQVDLKPGMNITSSITIRKDLYTLNALDASGKVSLESIPVIEISGNNIVVDFNNAILQGSNDKQTPEEFYGVAVRVKGGKNITIKNLRAKGYKVALMATDVEGLVIENCNFSYNYRQHLNSTQEKEDISDWMSYHQNEKDEWLRYGAAMYLRNCNKSRISGNIVTGGQCALMMTQCNDGLVYNNDFSFNSAIGIGMYRSSRNKIISNYLDFNVRGYSYRVYRRGQDSAAILVFEQCNENVFAFNSATFSGDGFFLWAGQTTMDTGEGGCNGNLIYANDFSFAPTNGIEVTFSSNDIIRNVLIGCDHGIWGGYSFNSRIEENRIRLNRIGIAIEHGQNILMNMNRFEGNTEGIRLWARAQQPADWTYPQKRDTRSKNYLIMQNQFLRDSIAVNINRTDSIYFPANEFEKVSRVLKTDSTVGKIDSTEYNEDKYEILTKHLRDYYPFDRIDSISLPAQNKLPKNVRWNNDMKELRITEWGPYDFRSPLLWRSNPTDTSGLLKFEILGPKGKWKLVGSKGVEGISKSAGSFPDNITARKLKGHKGEIYIELEYTQTELGAIRDKPITQLGKEINFGEPFKFVYRDARVSLQWETLWFNFDSVSNPVRDSGFIQKLQGGEPFMRRQVNDFNFAWWGGLSPGAGQKPYIQFLTVAKAEAELEPGDYELSVTWDDAARIWLDGRLILNEWNPSLYKFDESPNRRVKLGLGGKHQFKVEHVELGGFATISVKLKKL